MDSPHFRPLALQHDYQVHVSTETERKREVERKGREEGNKEREWYREGREVLQRHVKRPIQVEDLQLSHTNTQLKRHCNLTEFAGKI